jgi:Alpha/beta hydrolase domain
VTDVAGNNLDLPNDVRAYLIAGAPHFSDPAAVMRTSPMTALPVNPVHAGPPMRALLTAMRSWISDGVEPPSSRVPTKAAGTLVSASQAMPHDIPLLLYSGIYTGVTLNDNSLLPPKEIGRYPVYVPRLDSDGMSISGIRMLPIAVPRATYTGWNPRAEGYGMGALYPLLGAVVPFAATRTERDAAKDPRPSLAERYPDDSAYVEAVRAAASQLVAERLLLIEDAQRAIDAAGKDQLSKLHRP